jgi:hypothetical protein
MQVLTSGARVKDCAEAAYNASAAAVVTPIGAGRRLQSAGAVPLSKLSSVFDVICEVSRAPVALGPDVHLNVLL